MISIRRSLASIAGLLVLAMPGWSQEHHAERHGRHGNPDDLSSYIERLSDPSRDAWQLPERVIDALGLEPGKVACDIGVGPGYFTLRLAKVVGAGGRVYAVDVEPVMLQTLLKPLQAAGLANVTPILALPDAPLLPEGVCDVALIVNTYHHFPDGPAYLRRLARSLAPGGRVVNIDFHPGAKDAPRHSIAREVFLEQAKTGGFGLEREEEFLSRQYFLVLRPAS